MKQKLCAYARVARREVPMRPGVQGPLKDSRFHFEDILKYHKIMQG